MRKYLSKLRQQLKIKIEHQSLSFYSYPEALLYLADMAKDGLDTFTAYKTARHRRRDLLQGFYGLKNTIVGIALGCFIPLAFIGEFCYRTIPALFSQGSRVFLSKIKNDFYWLGIDLFGSSTQTLRGVTQIVAWPLSILRSSWRSVLSRNKEWENFQDRKSIVSLVKKADSVMQLNNDGSVGLMRKVLGTLTRKANSNVEKKQDSGKVKIPVQLYTNGLFTTSVKSATVENYIKNNRRDTEQLTDVEIEGIRHYIKNFRQ